MCALVSTFPFFIYVCIISLFFFCFFYTVGILFVFFSLSCTYVPVHIQSRFFFVLFVCLKLTFQFCRIRW